MRLIIASLLTLAIEASSWAPTDVFLGARPSTSPEIVQAHSVIQGRQEVGTPPTVVAVSSRCRPAYTCKRLRQSVCVNRGRTPKPVLGRAASRHCTAYRFRISFVFAYNGSQVWITRSSVHCPVSGAHVVVHVACGIVGNGGTIEGEAIVQAVVDASLGLRGRGGGAIKYEVFVFVNRHGRVRQSVHMPPTNI